MFWTCVVAAAAAAPPNAEAVRDSMGDHWSRGSRLRELVIFGELELASEQASAWIASLEPAAAESSALLPALGALRDARSIGDQGGALAALASSCGTCHQAQDRTRSWEPPRPPGVGSMERHRAGLEWMWAGLVGNAPQLYEVGVNTLDVERTDPLLVILDGPVAVARKADTRGARAKAFSGLIVTCAGCHTAARTQGPPAFEMSQMHERGAWLQQAKHAVVANDQDRWQEVGALLAAREDRVSSPWDPWISDTNLLAARLSTEKDRRAAATFIGLIATRCGACHRRAGGGPQPETRDAGVRSPTDALWWALITSDDEGWARASKQLGLQPAERPEARAARFAEALLRP